MRLVSFAEGTAARPGCLVGERVYDLRAVLGRDAPATMVELLRRGLARLRAAIDALPFDPAQAVPAPRLLAPVPRPGKIVAIGRNYRAHAAETGTAPQERPRLLIKLPSAVIGPDAPIRRPPGIAKLDWEVEIAVIIGSPLGAAAESEAADAIAGYTILNDVTARDLQLDVSPPQTSFAKSMDGFAPMGPALVSADEVGPPEALWLRSWVNGRLMQEACASDMMFPIPVLLSYISRFIALEPGDVVATGTPAGVGAFRNPAIFLQPGDRVRLAIDRLGVLENPVV